MADPARGTVMGNRGGMFHDPETLALPRRRWASRRWLCCALDYPGRHRHPVWSRGYTQLFFLDEVTALAAGHRPCAECRRPAALAYARALSAAGVSPSLAELDRRLHGERLEGEAERKAAGLPDGAMFTYRGSAYAVRDGTALRWSAAGYAPAGPLPATAVAVLTPATTLQALAAGYAPLWHPTATQTAPRA